MPDNYIQDFMARIVAMELEAMASETPPLSAAKPFWPYEQSAFPYMYNRPGASVYNYAGSEYTAEDIGIIARPVLMRLVVDHLTARYEGDTSDQTLSNMDTIAQYFINHPGLTTNAGDYTSVPDYLTESALLQGDTGLVVFQTAGIEALQLGVEFTLNLTYLREFNQA